MSTLTERTDAEILDAAADRIERDGWHQGYYYPSARFHREAGVKVGEFIRIVNPPCCTAGALFAEGGDGSPSCWSHITFADNLATWNDEPGRTKEEVVAALRAAAAQARGEA